MTILCVGIRTDIQLIHYMSYLKENNYEYYFLDQHLINYSIELDSNGVYENGKLLYNYSAFKGVYNRLAAAPYKKEPDNTYLSYLKINQFLSYMLEKKFCNVVNPLCNSISNDSKPYQSYIASKHTTYLKYPPTQILLHCNNVQLKDKIICKSTGSVRSIVTSVETAKIKNSAISSPLMIQEEIIGNDIRVHVVNGQTFCSKVESSEVDYRYNLDAQYAKHTLKEEIRQECLNLAAQFKLPLTGIDLIESNGEYYFLEANPSPGFYFYEQRLDTREVSSALTEFLVGTNN